MPASGAAFVCLMDEGGTTLAASNWREPLSFVGVNYGYRPYFRGAVEGRETIFFAVRGDDRRPDRRPRDPRRACRRRYPAIALHSGRSSGTTAVSRSYVALDATLPKPTSSTSPSPESVKKSCSNASR